MQRDRPNQPGIQRPKLKLGTFQNKSRLPAASCQASRPAGDHLADTVDARQTRRRDGLRGDRAGSALAGFGGATIGKVRALRPTPGRRALRLDVEDRRGLHLARARSIIRSLPPSNAPLFDHISNGRFTPNVVCGWNGPEMEMFDLALTRHEDRYARAQEWLDIVKRFWTEDDDFDHEGRFYRNQEELHRLAREIRTPIPATSICPGSLPSASRTSGSETKLSPMSGLRTFCPNWPSSNHHRRHTGENRRGLRR